MIHPWQHHIEVALDRDRVVRRRDFLRTGAATGLAAGTLSWTDLLSARAGLLRRNERACILLWMQGGPSQFETFSPKPDHASGGETKAISTAVPGIKISENFPRVARIMDKVALIRSVTSKEGSHPRASFLLHTGYLPTASVKHPTFGAIAAHEIGQLESELPSFVRIGGPGRNTAGSGLLGVEYDPFVLRAAGRLPENAQITTDARRFHLRRKLLGRLERDYAAAGGEQEVADHQKIYEKASRMILSTKMKAFDLDKETDAVREAYGRTPFGSGCLLARRLVGAGVTFVEVTLGNWDTHQDNFERTRNLAEQVDRPMAALIADLKRRGMLDSTLVVWMGEFGRTPKINPRGGRDHFPRAFNVALAGGGIRGGQVVGKTDAGGAAVTDRPVTVQDLFRTFCKSLKIDADRENMSPIGRPIKIVDGGQTVDELFS